MAGIDITHIPYKGGGQAVQDLVGGQVPMGVARLHAAAFRTTSPASIRIIAFTSQRTLRRRLPEMPTLHESGLAGFDTTQWLGILAPAGTPR